MRLVLLTAGLAATTIGLQACSDITSPTPSEPETVEVVAEEPVVELTGLEDYDTIYNLDDLTNMFLSSETTRVIPGTESIRLDGGVGNNPGYRTDGANFELEPRLERAFSGNTVKIGILARRTAGSDPTRLAVAYSTNDQGNSGWQRFDLSDEFELIEMTYDVPAMVAGRGDYIGFGPGAKNGSVEIKSIGLDLAD